jgi:hypothetical protein
MIGDIFLYHRPGIFDHQDVHGANFYSNYLPLATLPSSPIAISEYFPALSTAAWTALGRSFIASFSSPCSPASPFSDFAAFYCAQILPTGTKHVMKRVTPTHLSLEIFMASRPGNG